MLHLDARVALDEEVATGLGRHQELHRRCIRQAGLCSEPNGIGMQPVTQAGVKARRGSDLDDLLVALLHRAVPFPQMRHVSVEVGQHLHLDVARSVHEALHKHSAVAEGCRRLTGAPFERLSDVLNALHSAHAPAATTGCGLQHHRQTDLRGGVSGRSCIGNSLWRSSGDRNLDRSSQCAGADLVAEELERVCGGAHKRQSRFGAAGGKGRVLCQESVARVNAVAAVLGCDPQQCVDVQVRSQRIASRQRSDLVRGHQVQRALVDWRMHGHRLDSEGVGCFGAPDGDLAAIGDQDTGEAHDPPSIWPSHGRVPAILARN